MRMSRSDKSSKFAPSIDISARGEVELVANGEHFERVVLKGILQAKTSLDIATANFKSMLVPDGRDRARSIVEVMRDLAKKGVEIRLLHSGVPSSPVLRELRKELPVGITIRRCPRLHTKAVIIDCGWMYLGSANLTGAGLGAKAEGRRNFEMGALTRVSGLVDAVLDHFNTLWEGRYCESCKRHEVCPVPLEEPELG